jgi:hypothetical protein
MCVRVRVCVCACVCVCVLDHKIYGRLAGCDVVALDGTYSEQEVSVYFTGVQTLVSGFCTIVAGLSVELKEAMLATRNSSIDFIAHWYRESDQAHPSGPCGWDFFCAKTQLPNLF